MKSQINTGGNGGNLSMTERGFFATCNFKEFLLQTHITAYIFAIQSANLSPELFILVSW